jgi:hypothetical protein
MLAVARLDQHLADASPVAAGPARHLHQLGEQALAGAVILREQRGVRVQDADQGQLLEVVALGDHLGADQDVDLAAVHGVEGRLRAALQARGIGVDAQDARLREHRLQAFLDALGAASERLQVDVAAGRAGMARMRISRLQWWQRSRCSGRCSTMNEVQRVQSLIQPQASQQITGA